MTRLEATLSLSNVESHEYENRVETERLYSILQEQDQVLDALHERISKEASPNVGIDDEDEEKENSFCSRREWLGNPEFYNQLTATKEEYQYVVSENYFSIITGAGKRKGDCLSESAKKQKTGEPDRLESTAQPTTAVEEIRNSGPSENSTSLNNTCGTSLTSENWDDEDDDGMPLPWQDISEDSLNIFSLIPANNFMKLPENSKEFIIVVSESEAESDDENADFSS